jgi:mannose-1-phosphate guanylyltransferase
MDMDRYAVIMAGGRGERFWPRSRSERPKQFLTLAGDRSLLQQTVDRLAPMFAPDHVYVVLGQNHLALAREQLPDLPAENFIVEPVGRNTAPCIGLAAIHIHRKTPDAAMLVCPADHLIQGEEAFMRCLEQGFLRADQEQALVTIGIIPSRPETGYGYIQREDQELEQDPRVYSVRRFVEKPDLERAKEFVRTGKYYWNSGIFIWNVAVILEQIQTHLPDLHAGLQTIRHCIGEDSEENVLAEIFPGLPSISIDYGVMEKAPRIFMVEGDFGWDDLGSWGALASIAETDQNGMSVKGTFVGHGNNNCFVRSDGMLVAAVGLQDMIIVQDGNVILICPRERTQDVKELVSMLKENSMDEYL